MGYVGYPWGMWGIHGVCGVSIWSLLSSLRWVECSERKHFSLWSSGAKERDEVTCLASDGFPSLLLFLFCWVGLCGEPVKARNLQTLQPPAKNGGEDLLRQHKKM